MALMKCIFSTNNKGKKERQLEVLRPILDRWFDVLDEYAEKKKLDLPWWYGERSQIGFLAVAAWRAGGIALEEWPVEKYRKQKRSHGRNDLWIQFRGREFFIEAKHNHIHFHKGLKRCEDVLKQTLDDARSSAKALGHKTKVAVAAAFCSLNWNPKKRRKSEPKLQLSQALADWEAACKQAGADLVALVVDNELHSKERLLNYSKVDKSVGLAVLLKSCS